MKNGEWEKENKKLKNGKWRVENGEQRMENGRIKWEIENGKLMFFFQILCL